MTVNKNDTTIRVIIIDFILSCSHSLNVIVENENFLSITNSPYSSNGREIHTAGTDAHNANSRVVK